MTPNQFKCFMCGGVFENSWTEQEAIAEYTNNGFGPFPSEDTDCIVCDDCYKNLTKVLNSSQKPLH